MHIKMGDDGIYNTTDIGTIAFQRDSCSPLRLKDVMYVPRLNKNLVFIAVWEYRGYDVIFKKGNSFMRHVNKIMAHVKNLYKLDEEDCVELSTKAKKVQNRDVDELWHRRHGHLYHGALNIMHHISIGLQKGSLEKHDTCKGCNLGKYKKSTFHDRDNKAHVVLARIHFDVCGPFSTSSNSRNNCFVIFIDYYS